MTGSANAAQSVPQVRAETLLAALPFAILAIDADGAITFANPAAEQFFDMSAAMIRRQGLPTLVSGKNPVLALAGQAQSRNMLASEYGIEIVVPRFGPRTVDFTACPITDAPGAALLIFHERTIAQRMDRQLTQLQLGNSVSSMAAILAHEIKNPLAGIRGAAQLIERNASGPDRSLTRLIRDEADRIRNLVDRTEVFTDRRPIAPAPVNIHEVLDHVKQLAQSSFGKSVAFVENYDPSLPPVAGDRDRLVQVFLNLVKNATDALAGTGDAEIVLQTAYRPGVHFALGTGRSRMSLPLEVSVRDNGTGIPETIRDTLFEPFVSSKAKGQGLGLAITAKIVADHGGTIDCDSEPRRTIFRVRLPMYRINGEAQPAKEPTA